MTFKSGDFHFDSGAHRFHDKDRVATETIRGILSGCLERTTAPSRIYSGGELVGFPLSAIGLLKSLGIFGFVRSTYQIVRSRLWSGGPVGDDLEGYATRTYGNDIAERFLLNYSEKLWGVSADRLSSGMARARLKGLSLRGFLREAVFGPGSDIEHLDGSFYYPEGGIGRIADSLAEIIGNAFIETRSRVTKVEHRDGRIRAIIINGTGRVEVNEVISTIPLTHLVEILDPSPAEAVLKLTRTLHYRNLILVALFLRKDRATREATVYFPDKDFVFTRAYEPKNRGRNMAPRGQTCLVLEVPCDPGDIYWEMADERLVELTLSQIAATGWITPQEVMGSEVRKMAFAYPVVDLDSAGATGKILGFLEGFSNLSVSGRNGRFAYCSIHDLMIESRRMAATYQPSAGQPAETAGLRAR